MHNQQSDTQFQASQPLVTFIVAYYNLPPSMLRACIDSLLALSLSKEEREIIVIDDGSEKSPWEELTGYEDEIIYLRKQNGGVSSARNMGLRTATGRYIQFVDGDDWLIQPAYDHCLDIVRSEQPDMVLYDFSLTPDVPSNYEDSAPLGGTSLMHNQNIHGSACTCIFRSNILGNLTFTPGISYGEDEEFTPQLILRAEKVVCTNAKAYYYRKHGQSAIGNKSKEAIQQRLNNNHQVIRNLKQKSATMPTAERVALERRVAQLTMDYIYNIIVLTRDGHLLDNQIAELRKEGLFPLPNRDYTTKYKWFRRMTNTSVGRAILKRMLPLWKIED